MPKYSNPDRDPIPDINAWLARLDLTAAQLARALRVDPKRICEWNNRGTMANPTLLELALEKIESDLQSGRLDRECLKRKSKGRWTTETQPLPENRHRKYAPGTRPKRSHKKKSTTPPTTQIIHPVLSVSRSPRSSRSTWGTPSSTSGGSASKMGRTNQ